MIDQRVTRGAIKNALSLGVGFLAVLAILLIGEAFFRGGRDAILWVWTLPAAALVSAFYLQLWLLALEMILSRGAALTVLSVVYWAFSVADGSKFIKLGVPALPSDLLLSGQYGKLAYMLWGSRSIIGAIFAGMVLVALVYWLWRRGARMILARGRRPYGQLFRLLCLACGVLLVTQPDYNFKNARFRHSIVASQLDEWGIFNLNWSPGENVMANGQLLSFLMNTRAVLVAPPWGYGEPLVDRALSFPVVDGAGMTATSQQVDIVVIMSEALWDPGILPHIRYSDPLLQRLDFASRGVLFSPVFGGYTANTEFEFLTRLSNANLPIGSVPYMQYVNRPINSLADDLRAAGYASTAVHPFDGGFWNRRSVYPRLGFEHFVEGIDFVAKEMTPPYISDVSMSKEIARLVQQGNKAHFIFAVSVQNHGAYLDGKTRYVNEPRVQVFDDSHRLSAQAIDVLSTYATGVRDAARSFTDVVDFYKTTGRAAVVVMFGDHLPFLGDDFLVYTQAGYLSNANQSAWSSVEQERMHGTPLFVWSNLPNAFPMPKESVSPIYLGLMLKRFVGIPETRMDALIDHMQKKYPVISQFYSRAADGHVLPGAPAPSGVMADYMAISYDELFGRNYAAGLIGRKASIHESSDRATVVELP